MALNRPQIFGEEEKLYGYRDLAIDVRRVFERSLPTVATSDMKTASACFWLFSAIHFCLILGKAFD